MKTALIKTWRQARRVRRIRHKMVGVTGRPRLAVSRSLKHICAQIVDDQTGRTLCMVTSQAPQLRDQVGYGGNVKAAAAIGKILGEKAKQLGIECVCFDRRGHRYHGRVKALAEAAREAGLKF
jgi:large subunit ribosomal protein L18